MPMGVIGSVSGHAVFEGVITLCCMVSGCG